MFMRLVKSAAHVLGRNLLFSMLAVALLATAVRAPFFGDGVAASDTTVYLNVAEEILQGYFPSDLRPPGYSLLLAAFDGLGIDAVSGIVTLQNAIGIFLPAGVLLVGWRFFSPPVGVLAGFLTAGSPLMTLTEQLALADYLFGVALFTGTALLAQAALQVQAKQFSWHLLVAAGAMFGIATLFRANGQLAFVAIPLVLLIAARDWRAAIRPAAAAIAGVLLVVTPWVLHNLVVHGNPSVATEGGISLYSRVITWDRVPPPADAPNGQLALSIYKTAEPGPLAGVESGRPTTALYDALRNQGMSESEASSTMGALARKALFEHFDIYLENTLDILTKYRSLYDPRTFGVKENEDHISLTRSYIRTLQPEVENIPGDSGLTRTLWQVSQTLTKLIYAITLGGIVALLLPFVGDSRRRLTATAFLVVLILGMVGGSLFGVFSPRYDIMFAPMVWILLAAAIALIGELAVLALRRLRPGW